MIYCHRIKIGHIVSTVMVGLVMSTMLSGCSQPRQPPQLVIDGSVASDFEALAAKTWAQFLAVFEARTDCFGDVQLHAARSLGSRAVYDPASARVTVRSLSGFRELRLCFGVR
jgi:hypothetical protein